VSVRAPHQLPPGRHGIPRAVVVGNQRQRILEATATLVRQHGFVNVSVDAIVAEAGVSRRTFYEQFANRQEALVAAIHDGKLPPTLDVAHTLGPDLAREIVEVAA
jgi:AcrR family transcriptional regulator